MNIYIASMSQLLYTVLLWTLGCMFLFELQCLSFWDMCPGVELLDHMATLFLVFWGTFLLFSLMAASIYISTSSVGGFPTSSPVYSICLSDFKTLAFVSRSLIITWLGMDLGKLSWCGLTWNLLGVWPIGLCLLSNGKFSPSISVNSSHQLFLFFPNDMNLGLLI